MSIRPHLGDTDDVLVCKATQTSPWCQYSLEKAGEDHSALPSVHGSACASATAGPRITLGVIAVAKLAQPSGEASLQVLISLLRGLCENERGNTQAGKLTMRHQAGRLLCPIFKVPWRKMLSKDYCGTVSWHIPYSMDLYHSVKRNNLNQSCQKLPAEFLSLKYLRNILEALSLSSAS